MFRDKTDRGLRSYTLRFSIMVVVLISHLVSAEKGVTRRVKKSGDAIQLLPYNNTPRLIFRTNEKKKDFRWKFSPLSETGVTTLINNKVTDLCKGRCELFENGTLSFKQVQRTDSGIYTVEVYDGHLFLNRTEFQLLVLDPVSKPVVKGSCTVDGRISLSCSVDEGDQVLFQWTTSTGISDGHNLLLGRIMNESVICVASNDVSRQPSAPVQMACRAHVSAVVAVTGVLSIFMASIIFFSLRKRRQQGMKTEGPQEENVYVVMTGNRGTQRTEEEAKSLEEGGEESPYVTCASIRPTMTQTSVPSMDNIYVGDPIRT